METVKVDIQKLQLLNDRITQTIEALNQVRMSVHGIQHTTPTTAPWMQTPYVQTPYYGTAWNAWTSPWGTSPVLPQGLQHTTAPQMFGTPGWLPTTTPWDPTWQLRTGQTFPFVQHPYPMSVY